MYRYIFNTSGNYVAFISNNNLFNPNADWIGFIRNGNEVYSSQGCSFIGYVSSDDRIVRRHNELPKIKPFKPFTPFRPFKPFTPFKRLHMPRLAHPWFDVFDN